MSKLELLKNLNFGERVAEEDENLTSYFVETNIWQKLKEDTIDIVYGAKGSGKSALYKYLLSKEEEFLRKNILLIPAENLRGATVFKQVLGDNELEENMFKHLWFIYILTLVGNKLKNVQTQTKESKKFINKLEDENLLAGDNLRSILHDVRTYVIDIFKAKRENSVTIDPQTGAPTFSSKILETEPSSNLRSLGAISVYEFLDMADKALESLNLKSWITLDRLDVAFSDNATLESTALKTLFSVYNDIKASTNIKLKIFIRDDIWKRIINNGIREGSHITKHITITWSEQDFLFLLVSRIVQNLYICNHFRINKDETLSDIERQEEIFYKIYPDKVEVGKNPKTFNWMLGRIKDGLGISAPRELIHLLNESREYQIRLLETGTKEDSYERLISRPSLKEALKKVSTVRLDQTIYQEYPELKQYIKLLEEEKTEQDVKSLTKIFGTNINETKTIANKLVSIGFFQEKEKNNIYWVPFLYRGGLNMSQGKKKKQ